VTDPSGDTGSWSARTSPLGTSVIVVAASPPPPPPMVNHSKGETPFASIIASVAVSGIIAAFVVYMALVPTSRGESSSASLPLKKTTGIESDVGSSEMKKASSRPDRGGDKWLESDDDNYRGTI